MSSPTLFLPGTLCDERVWLPVWQRLSLFQRRYVPLQWANSKEEMLALTSDRVLDDEKVHLVGFSMGGYMAATWAIQNKSQVASLTMIGASPYGLTPDEEKRRTQLMTMLKKGNFQPEKQAYVSRFVHPSHHDNPEVAGVVREMGKDLGAATLLAHTSATTPRASLIDKLKTCSFPVNIIAASDDEVVPFNTLEQAANAIHGGKLITVKHAGHMCLLEQPDALAESIQAICS